MVEVTRTPPLPPPVPPPLPPLAFALPVFPDDGLLDAEPAVPLLDVEVDVVVDEPLLPEGAPVAVDEVVLLPDVADPVALPLVVAEPELPLVPVDPLFDAVDDEPVPEPPDTESACAAAEVAMTTAPPVGRASATPIRILRIRFCAIDIPLICSRQRESPCVKSRNRRNAHSRPCLTEIHGSCTTVKCGAR